jgi:hypothetical protein
MTDTGEMRTYYGVVNLDRKLVEQNGACLSGPDGHCTLPENRKAFSSLNVNTSKAMECVKDYECTGEYQPRSRIKNKLTDETYGICISHSEAEYLDFDAESNRACTMSTGHTYDSIVIVLLVMTAYSIRV